jgi:putative FmdB family regulatory protein
MPIYEYGCDACGHKFEEQQKMADPPLRVCPQCGKESLEKLIAATSFVLKGGGWYKDGYGNPNKTPRTENQRADRLQKAIDDDKKKTAAAAPSTSGDSSSPTTAAPSSSSSDTTKAPA